MLVVVAQFSMGGKLFGFDCVSDKANPGLYGEDRYPFCLFMTSSSWKL